MISIFRCYSGPCRDTPSIIKTMQLGIHDSGAVCAIDSYVNISFGVIVTTSPLQVHIKAKRNTIGETLELLDEYMSTNPNELNALYNPEELEQYLISGGFTEVQL